jgi:tetratricopeptide (TPR) repeat protein
MFHILRRIWRDFPTWERSAQIAFALALVLLVTCLIAVAAAPQTQRSGFLVSAGVLLLVLQGVVMWANRGMISPFTQAQRAYLRGDFAAAVAALEPVRQSGKADMRELTLLGNTYRQLGRLDESAEVLSEAVDKVPNHHYSLYGFGRTLIVQGSYAEGAAYIARALAAGAPSAVRFEYAEALHRLGRWEEARGYLDAVRDDEPHRLLMAALWRWRHDGGAPPGHALMEQGIPFWQAQAERFAATEYGSAVADDLRELRMLLTGENKHVG